MQTIRGMGTSHSECFRVGITDTLPKLMTHRLLAPALEMEPKYRLVCKDFNVGVVGKTQEISESYYAITLDRKLTHPALVAIAENAKAHFLSKD